MGIGDGKRIDELLDEAEAFERGGEPLEALARARHAGRFLSDRVGSAEDPMAEELRARVDFATRRYEALAEAWQRDNASRHEAYLRRERAAIGAAATNQTARRAILGRRGWGRLGRSRAT